MTADEEREVMERASKRERNRRRFRDWTADYYKLTPPPPMFPDGCDCDRYEIHGFGGTLVKVTRVPLPDCTAHEEYP